MHETGVENDPEKTGVCWSNSLEGISLSSTYTWWNNFRNYWKPGNKGDASKLAMIYIYSTVTSKQDHTHAFDNLQDLANKNLFTAC